MNAPSIFRVLWWLVAAISATAVLYAAFRAYILPDALIGFANLFVC
jgi:hypothetical protein